MAAEAAVTEELLEEAAGTFLLGSAATTVVVEGAEVAVLFEAAAALSDAARRVVRFDIFVVAGGRILISCGYIFLE